MAYRDFTRLGDIIMRALESDTKPDKKVLND